MLLTESTVLMPVGTNWVLFLCGNSILKCWEVVGGWDENFINYMELTVVNI